MRWTLLIFIFVFSLFGCDQAKMVEKNAPKEAVEAAKNYVRLLQEGKFDLIKKDFDSSLDVTNAKEAFSAMQALMPMQESISLKLVGANVVNFYGSNGAASSTTNITLEYEHAEKFVLINIATTKDEQATRIIAFNVTPIADSLEKLNRFSLSGKSSLHYFIFVIALIIPFFTIFTFVLCLKTKIEKRKWLWVVFTLVGIGNFSLNWTTGEWGLSLFSIRLLGAGVFSEPYSPWIISLSLPIGTILFLLKRKQWA